MQPTIPNFRLLLVCALAASVGLPIGIVSLAKLTLFIGTLILLVCRSQPVLTVDTINASRHLTFLLIFGGLLLFAASLSWTSGSQREGLNSVSKYGKLLIIPIFGVLIQSRREALYALAGFAATQLFLISSSWLLFLKVPVPWALSPSSISQNVVFSSYLDEGLMSVVFAAVSWNLRALVPGKHGSRWAAAASLLAMGHVLFLLQGRSAHVVAVVLLTFVITRQLPRRLRIAAVAVPFLLVTVLYLSSAKVQTRLDSLKSEVQTFSFEKGADGNTGSSSGIRLHFWRRAMQSISEHPAAGSGAGSWSNEFNRLETVGNPAHGNIKPLGNPHQEYLLWGVQLGVPGVVLLVALMLSIYKDTRAMETQTARAAQSALLALAVACLFNSSLYDAQIGDFFCVILGLLLALGLHPQNSRNVTAQPLRTNSPA